MATRIQPQPEDFDFSGYLFLLERVLPKRGKARKLLPELEAYVHDLYKRGVRPWEVFNANSGAERDQATTALFESMLKIAPEWRYEVGIRPAVCASSLRNAPKPVENDVRKLLKRERNFCYIEPFVTLGLKGDVTLTDKHAPVEGSVCARTGGG